MTQRYLFTSESVSDGHPDKLADRISDTVLDRCLTLDAHARVACETLLADNLVVVAGEFGFRDDRHFEQLRGELDGLVRGVLRETGYDDSFPGIDPDRCEVLLRVHGQSVEIAGAVVHEDGELGAGDQGLMFGYACDETPELMPLAIRLAHRIMQQHKRLRGDGTLPWLRPDAKAQVTLGYEDGRPATIETVVVSTQTDGTLDEIELHNQVMQQVVAPIMPKALMRPHSQCLVNPGGRFEAGGPHADAGLTGRKIIVDTYGGSCPHGGGAFSGKDPTKVDRSAAYAARWVAKTVVAAELASKATVQLAYAIGRAAPVSVRVDTHGTASVDEADIEKAVHRVFDLSPAGIIRDLELTRPIYAATAAFGHFGRELPEFTWESTARVDALRAELGLGPGAPEKQRQLSRFMKELHGAGQVSDEMRAWWANRY
ncbi:methionine adenosyltransferase [Spectribacter acetivorans]|uniref:methionine adenosyltransferase n=1 Tax=Spectribacter acetivorans TaxID=3075603 RepID=UPI0032C20F8D